MQIAIVSRSGPVLDAYKWFLAGHSVTLLHASSIDELYRMLFNTPVSGVMIEIQAVVKATNTEKEFLQAIEEVFPNIKTNWDSAGGFRALYQGAGKSGEENIVAFVQHCLDFKPRTLRKNKRHERKCNVLFWPIGKSEETAQRAFTIDISSSGLFVCTCDPPEEGSVVWVMLCEVGVGPFKVLVKWKREWGVAMRIPGFGGSFVEMDNDLQTILDEFLTKENDDFSRSSRVTR